MGDIRKLKEGPILRYKAGFLGKKWKDCWGVLFSDSSLCWYDKKTDQRPAGSVLLKDVIPYTCVGMMCDRMPVRRPEMPERHSVHHLVGIGNDPQASKVQWFLFSSDSDLESWFTEIMKTLPKPNPPPAPPGQQPQSSAPPTYSPPSVYPTQPPAVAPTYPSQATYPSVNQQQSYPIYSGVPQYGNQGGATTPSHTTVVIQDRGGGYGGGYGGSGGGSSGLGLGTGMLMGSLLGFGLGSVWGGGLHSGFGHGGFGGMGYGGSGYGGTGLGGGYIQDNDTYVTNNYYNYDPNDGQRAAAISDNPTPSAVDSSDVPVDHAIDSGADAGYDVGGGYDFDAGNDFDGYDAGGDDFGGDFGGGDW